jgi:hypothetical protein
MSGIHKQRTNVSTRRRGEHGELQRDFRLCEPLRSLQPCVALLASWSNLSGTLTTAGPLQLELSNVSGLNTNPPARFFRVKLLP